MDKAIGELIEELWNSDQASALTNRAARVLESLLEPRFPIELLTCIYTDGYGMGHHDTVEGQYTDIHYSDRETYFRETVEDWIVDHPEYFHKGEE